MPDATLSAKIAALDLEGKVRLLTGATMFTLHGEPDIGLDEMAFSDGPTGVRGLTFIGGEQVALLPNATLISASWDEDIAYEVGEILAEEAERQRIHVVLGPTINLHRTPLGGRLFEAYSEDPLLTGRLASSYVRGLQANGIGACLKHLVANESETDRHTVNSVVEESTLREVYLLPFEMAVEDSDPWSIMAAYNDVNGVPATEQDDIINGIVKGEWGYTGLIMSDWFATKSAAGAANGGLDLVMPGPDGPWGDALVTAVRSGAVREDTIDEHLRRLLRLADRVGALDRPRSWRGSLPEPTAEVRREQLVRIAASGMTVLANDGVLPLRRADRLVLIGRHALETIDMGGGSAQVRPPHQISVAEGLGAVLGERLVTLDGVEVRTRAMAAPLDMVRDPETGQAGIRATALNAHGHVLATSHVEGSTVSYGFDDDLEEFPATARLVAEIGGSGRRQVGVIGAGSWTIRVAQKVHDVELALGSGDVGEAILRPPGWTTVIESDQLVTLEATVRPLVDGFGRFAVVARPAPRSADEVIGEAVAAAADAEIAVVVVGLTEEQETEAADKETLALPGEQDALVAAVAKAARRTVVVVNAATPVLMPWATEVDAILWAGIPGQEGGHAVAAALLGTIEPSGRLVTTFPSSDGGAPAWSVVPVDGALVYAEGAFVGYRGHAVGLAPEPAFWFGHGLGYGAWEYGPGSLEWTDQGATVRVSLTNTGNRDSREVVQVYYQPSEQDQPIRLVGWQGSHVAPGASDEVSVACDPRMLRRWDPTHGHWTTLAKDGTFLIARGLGDVRRRLCRDHPERR